MKNTFILLAGLVAITYRIPAQNFTFSYDASGNRTDKSINPTKSTKDRDTDQVSYRQEEEISENIKIVLYPNPTKDDVFVTILNEGPDILSSISVYDGKGLLIKTLNSIENEILLGLSGFPPGNYFLVIQINGKTYNWKIIKKE